MQTILQNKEKIICEFESGCKAKIKRKCEHNFDNVDKPLLKWFKCARDEKTLSEWEMLLLKTQEIACASI